MESMVRAAAAGGLRAAIVNPTACLGPWDGKAGALALVPQLLAGAVPAAARREVNVIDVRDVAAGLRAALEAGPHGEPIPLCGHNVRADALCRRICELAGVPPPPFPASARLAAWALVWTEAAWAAGGRPSPLPALPALLLCDSYPMEPGPAQRALGLRPRPLDRTLADAIAWHRGRQEPPGPRSSFPTYQGP
jgi:dihydroflavonol-4-reductase